MTSGCDIGDILLGDSDSALGTRGSGLGARCSALGARRLALKAGSWGRKGNMPEFDVAFVGAGPAGAWAAYRLARGGANVAIIDGSHPREKPCGGGGYGRALQPVRSA